LLKVHSPNTPNISLNFVKSISLFEEAKMLACKSISTADTPPLGAERCVSIGGLALRIENFEKIPMQSHLLLVPWGMIPVIIPQGAKTAQPRRGLSDEVE
jgi:hypothetical protein